MPSGYARLNISIFISAAIVLSVLIYQSYVHGQIQAGRSLDAGNAAPRYVEVYPQTIPSLTKGLYELVVDTKTGPSFSLGSFAVQGDTDRIIVNAAGQTIANGLFPLPHDIGDLTRASLFIRADQSSGDRLLFVSGNFSGDRAHLAFAPGSFSEASGAFMLGTPTDGDATINEFSGVWFGDIASGQPTLHLPSLPAGWVYEGWAIENGRALTTGRFFSSDRSDYAAPFSAGTQGPNIPGEDFLRNAPVAVFPGLAFPLDLRAQSVAISVEPDIRGIDPTGAAPFGVNVLTASVSKRADARVLYDFDRQTEFPKASVVLR